MAGQNSKAAGQDVSVITDISNSPAARMASELLAIAQNNAQYSNAGEMAAQAANKMLAAHDDLDAILAAGEKAGLSAKDVIGRPLTIQSVEWAVSADRFEAPFGVFGIVRTLDASDQEVTYTTGAGNLVSALRAMEIGGHLPVTLRIAKRTTGAGELFYFTK